MLLRGECHCEPRSDEAIQTGIAHGLLRYARNDGGPLATTRKPSSLRTRRVKQSRQGAFSLDCRATLAMTGGNGRNDGASSLRGGLPTKQSRRGAFSLDCFASLAMTGG
ncbi:MAG: hypothetical protein LBT00_00470 [Spirochaetaceae bacterium]|nr:hypothetical protein [Spirochaetaceae bacterium]